jgi:hypothetical protein
LEPRRGRGPTRSSGRFRSTLIDASTPQVYGREPSRTRECIGYVSGLGILLVGAAMLACTPAASPSPPSARAESAASNEATQLLPGVTVVVAVGLTADDERCARSIFDVLINAVNKSNEQLLSPLFSGSFQWLAGIGGTTTYESREAVSRLLAVARKGERWELLRLELNGRGGHGGIDFGVQIRRYGPSVPEPYRDSAGKGVLDCPEGRIRLFGLGD